MILDSISSRKLSKLSKMQTFSKLFLMLHSTLKPKKDVCKFWKLLKELWNRSLLLTAACTKCSMIISLPLILVFEIVGCNLNSLCIFDHFQCTVCCHWKEDFQTSHFLKRMLSLRHLLTTQVLTEVIVCQKKKYIYSHQKGF